MGLPVAVMQSVGLVSGNMAIMYLPVGFCQMLKASTPACVYFVGCCMGNQTWSAPVAKTIFIITIGLVITSRGELKFNAYGFGLQVLAVVAESCRLNLVETRLKSQGLRINPLTSMLIFPPIVGTILALCVVVLDRDALSWPRIHEVGEMVFVANALVAFILNIAIYLAIQESSGLALALAGLAKDVAIIAGSSIFFGSTVSAAQVFGYTMAVVGLQAYITVSKAPMDFEASGVLAGLYQHWVAPFGISVLGAHNLDTNSSAPVCAPIGRELRHLAVDSDVEEQDEDEDMDEE